MSFRLCCGVCVPRRAVPQASHPFSWCTAQKRSCPQTSTTAVHGYEPTPRKSTKLRLRTLSTNSTRRGMWHYCTAPSTSRPCYATTSATCVPASSMSKILYSNEFKAARTSTSYHHLGRGRSSSTKCSDPGHTRSSMRTGGRLQRKEHRAPPPILSLSNCSDLVH
jgi:hypothetical protein